MESRSASSPRCSQVIARDVLDVLAVVAFLGPAGAARPDALRARLDGERELLDLRARVVVVELARDAVALRFEEGRDGVAEGRLASVADVQRAGGIGGDELDLHLSARLVRRASVACAFLEDTAHDPRFGDGPQGEVDEPGAGHLGFLQELARDPCCERGGEGARAGLQRFRQLQRHIGRIIAMARLLRALQHDRRVGELRRLGSQRGAQRLLERGFGIGTHRRGSNSTQSNSMGSTSRCQRTSRRPSANSAAFKAPR